MAYYTSIIYITLYIITKTLQSRHIIVKANMVKTCNWNLHLLICENVINAT